jgi:hypothetical protein
VRPIVRHHHERLDGTGYPDGLRNSEVPLLAQIISIVDIFDALTTERPYRGARPCDEAFQVLTGMNRRKAGAIAFSWMRRRRRGRGRTLRMCCEIDPQLATTVDAEDTEVKS